MKLVRMIPLQNTTLCLGVNPRLDNPKLGVFDRSISDRSIWNIVNNRNIQNYCHPSYFIKNRPARERLELGLYRIEDEDYEFELMTLRENEDNILCQLRPATFPDKYVLQDGKVGIPKKREDTLWLLNKLS